MSNALETLYLYNAWANADLLDGLDGVDPGKHPTELQKSLRLIGHSHVVAQIFASHLQGKPHGFTSDDLDPLPSVAELRRVVAIGDQWYLEYVRTVNRALLSESLAFSFIDGDKGYMTREEMLIHVALHSGYHRAEVGRILKQVSLTPPWDTFAVYLHQANPARRWQGQRTPSFAN